MKIDPFTHMNMPESVVCPADKSLTHRAIIFSGIAAGKSRIENPLLGEDCLSTISCLEKLGVDVSVDQDGNQVFVDSPGIDHFLNPKTPLDCGNSGTTARLLIGLLSSCPQLTVVLTGDESLRQRPMGRVVQPLREVGAMIDGPENGNKFPLSIKGVSIREADFHIDKATAQVKSALLLASLRTSGAVSITLPVGSRDHTEKLLAEQGARISVIRDQGLEKIVFHGPFLPVARSYQVPVDPSSAAFFCVLVLLRSSGELTLPHVLANPTRVGFLRVLERMTDAISVEHEEIGSYMEPVMSIRVRGGRPLKPVMISSEEVPTLIDEIPILAVAASYGDGESSFHGLDELRVKESDRLSGTQEMLQAAGIDCRISEKSSLIIKGRPGVAAKNFSFHSRDDHRLAMAAAVLARTTQKDGAWIENSSCVDISFPGFFELLEACR